MGNVAVQNTSASLTGKTLATLEGTQVVTGQKTFDLGASAPFVCVSGAAKVDHLDADLLDGEEASDFHDATQLVGTVPAANLPTLIALGAVCGRLTLTTALPVTTADVTAAVTLFYALYAGNRIALYTGSAWVLSTIAQLSIAVPATTSQMYDVFVDYNSGTPALSVTAWTNDTTRATALTTQDGVLVLTGSTGKRYVGSFRTTTVAGQTEDSATKRFVYNYYNRVRRPLSKTDTTANWSYSLATIRQARATATNQVEIVNGVAEDVIAINATVQTTNSTNRANVLVTIGENSTTAGATGVVGGTNRAGVDGSNSVYATLVAQLVKVPPVGYSYYAWLEASEAAGTEVWYGAALLTGGAASGLSGWVNQ
jgi:hypothetical protein